jgi:hypothetical protein
MVDFIVTALRELGQPSKPEDLLEPMKRAGWESTAANPTKMLENNLRALAKKKKVKALGARTFEAVAG